MQVVVAQALTKVAETACFSARMPYTVAVMNNFSELSNENIEGRLAHVAPNECGEDINPHADHTCDAAGALCDAANGLSGDDVSEYADELDERDDACDPNQDDGLLPGEDMDGDHASALASAGFGTDEDYGGFDSCDCYGGE